MRQQQRKQRDRSKIRRGDTEFSMRLLRNEDGRCKDLLARYFHDGGDRFSERCRKRRRLHAPCYAKKELVVEQKPQSAQALTHGGLRDIEGACRGRYASQPGERVEEDEEAEIESGEVPHVVLAPQNYIHLLHSIICHKMACTHLWNLSIIVGIRSETNHRILDEV